jgi:hypothetical protein
MRRRAAATLALALAILAIAPAPASAGLFDPICSVVGVAAPKWASVLCKGASKPGKLLGIGKKLLGGHVGSVLHTITGGGSGAGRAAGFAALVAWVLGGARFALHETATLIGKTTSPDLANAWFSSTYLHMAAIATLLTLPFLFAAVVQALMRSDLAMLARAALGYLPLAILAIALAAPLTTLLLAASDNASNIIEHAAGGAAVDFLKTAGGILGGLSLLAHSPFVAFLIGFFIAAGALMLWLELLLREVAVYVIVLMLPLVFAAFVWPARRIWAIRAVEILVALILAKLAIVSVLALGAGALDHSIDSSGIVNLVAGIALVTLGAFAPWALVKLLPLGELAAAAAGPLQGELHSGWQTGSGFASPWAGASSEWAGGVTADMRKQAMAADSTPEAGSVPERLEGVTGDEDPEPFLGTADPSGGENGAATGPEVHDTDPPERGATPPFQGFPGAEDLYQREREWPELVLGPEGMPPRPPDPPPPGPPPTDRAPGGPPPHDRPPPESDPPPFDDDPLPPAQDPEDGHL